MSTMDVTTDFARVISAATRSLHERRSVDEILRTIASVTCGSVPGFDQVGISTPHRTGHVVTRVFIGDLVLRLEGIQYGLWEGPCVDTMTGADLVTASGLRHEQRWARYVPQAVALGVRSQLALRLRDGDRTIGSINLYSTVSDDVDHYAQALAEVLASHSASALSRAQERAQLTEALHSRTIIGPAIGILMERYDIDEDRAFALLVRTSSRTNVKLRAVAQQILDERNSEQATRCP